MLHFRKYFEDNSTDDWLKLQWRDCLTLCGASDVRDSILAFSRYICC